MKVFNSYVSWHPLTPDVEGTIAMLLGIVSCGAFLAGFDWHGCGLCRDLPADGPVR